MEVSSNTSGAGGVMGGLTVSEVGSRAADAQPIVHNDQTPDPSVKSQVDFEEATQEKLREELQKREDAEFEKGKEQIEETIQNSDFKGLTKNLIIDMTPEGLRIQIVDRDGESMFPTGSAVPYEKTVNLLATVAEIIKKMSNQISVRGHTDASPYSMGANYTNWELSADRTNPSRRVLLKSGIDIKKLSNGKVLLGLVLGAAILAAAGWLMGVKRDALLAALARAAIWSVPASIGALYVLFTFGALRWNGSLRPLLKNTFWQGYWAMLISYPLNAILPAKGGDLFRINLMSVRTGVPRATVLGGEIMDKAMDICGPLPQIAQLVLSAAAPKRLGGGALFLAGVLAGICLFMIAMRRKADHHHFSSQECDLGLQC